MKLKLIYGDMRFTAFGFVADKVVSSGRDKTVKMWVLLLSYLLGF